MGRARPNPSGANGCTPGAGCWSERTDELSALIARENGKPVDDAVIEVTIAIAHLSWASEPCPPDPGPAGAVHPGLLAINHSATLEYLPFGVVGVIGPWNYPVHTPMGSISYALAAGNAVVFKPSEYTPAVGEWLVNSFAEVVPEQPVLQLVTGFADDRRRAVPAGVDKLAFTGSAATGRKVMAACAVNLTPCVVECGGKDAADRGGRRRPGAGRRAGGLGRHVQRRADLRRGGAGLRRARRSTRSSAARVVECALGSRPVEQYGPITMPGQLEVIARPHRRRAGPGRPGVGRRPGLGPRAVRAIRWCWPTCRPTRPPNTEETFGPTLVLTEVADLDEAVARANRGRYGLGASVFSRRHGRDIARRLDAGMVSINSVLTYASIPGLPWGGSKDSGFGRIHGPDGLREFARSRVITSSGSPVRCGWPPSHKSRNAVGQLKRLARLRCDAGR